MTEPCRAKRIAGHELKEYELGPAIKVTYMDGHLTHEPFDSIVKRLRDKERAERKERTT